MANPQDTPARQIGSKARQLLHASINTEHWEYHEETGNDVGRDCILELSENNEWLNHKIEGQIKGTQNINLINNNNLVSFPLSVRTIEYALWATIPFVLFVVDVISNDIYYQCIQDYFIENPMLFRKLQQETINIRIPIDKTLCNNDIDLQVIAKIVFVDGPGEGLKRYKSNL